MELKCVYIKKLVKKKFKKCTNNVFKKLVYIKN